jgi:hypothetical protein
MDQETRGTCTGSVSFGLSAPLRNGNAQGHMPTATTTATAFAAKTSVT